MTLQHVCCRFAVKWALLYSITVATSLRFQNRFKVLNHFKILSIELKIIKRRILCKYMATLRRLAKTKNCKIRYESQVTVKFEKMYGKSNANILRFHGDWQVLKMCNFSWSRHQIRKSVKAPKLSQLTTFSSLESKIKTS